MEKQHVEAVHALATLGVPAGTIWGWILAYGLPAVLQLLPDILQLIQNPGALTVQQIIAWAESALAAIVAGQPIPPLPTPAPTPAT